MSAFDRTWRKWFGRWNSVRGQLMLVVLVTTAVALLTMTAALLHRALTDYRDSQISSLGTEADILALLSAPALAFDDEPAGERNLAALSARPGVEVAALYGQSGQLFARYVRAGSTAPPFQLPPGDAAVRVAGSRLVVTREVSRNGEYLGVVYLGSSYSPWEHVLGYVSVLGLMMLLSLGVALVLTARLHRRVTGPVEALATVAQRIVSQRDLSLRAPQTSLQEFAVVVQAFNNVLDEIEERTRELRRSEMLYRAIGESMDYGVWVCDADGRNLYSSDSFLRLLGLSQAQCSGLGWSDALHPDDVEATMAAWQEAVRTGSFWYREHRYRGADKRYHPVLAQGVPIRDENGRITDWAGINLDIARLKKTETALRKANRRKDDFLATLAHELRNPLAPIRHAARLLGISNAEPAQMQMARDIIGRQVSRMALLLDDLLDVSRITRDRLELRRENVQVSALVKAAVETSKPVIDAKQHQFGVHMPEEPLELYVDPLRISQALSNLLTNAAKYTDSGGSVSLEVRHVDDHTEFSVRDSGIGLTQDALSSVFEMFSQMESAIDRSEDGLGIGLALVKGLVSLHGGGVEAVSEGPGLGSTFTMRLPGGRVAVDTAREEVPAERQSSSDSSGRILVVDDNADAATTLAMVLRNCGHEVFTAGSGPQALDIGEQHQPNVVILDIGMPDMNGYEVAGRMRQTRWGDETLLLALTGWGHKDDVARAQAAGFDGHMTKPVDPGRVEAVIDEFLKTRRRPGIALEH
jgi:PAS domain S-box-containing protein